MTDINGGVNGLIKNPIYNITVDAKQSFDRIITFSTESDRSSIGFTGSKF